MKESARDKKIQRAPVESQNVTLALPKALLRRVKHLAIEREKSLSGLLVEALEEMVRHDDSYEQAYERWRESMKKPRNLGLGGKISWTRDELHERR